MYIYVYIYTVVTSYIKDADRCIFMNIQLRTGWYVSYTPWIQYAHLRNIILQLTIGPLVAIVIEKQSFQLRRLSYYSLVSICYPS